MRWGRWLSGSLLAALAGASWITSPAHGVTATYDCAASPDTELLSVGLSQVLTFTIQTTRTAPGVNGCREMFFYNESRIAYSMEDDLGNPYTIQYGSRNNLTNGRTYTLTVTVPGHGSGDLLAFTLNNGTTPLYGSVVRLVVPGA